MKFNIKALGIGIGFLWMGNLFAATTAPVDPDLAVYNAIVGMGFTLSSDGATVATLPATVTGATASTDANIANFLSVLTNAKAFYTSDGTTAPTVAPLLTYYTAVDKFLGAVNAKKTALVTAESAAAQLATNQTNAKATLTAANAATDLTTLNAKISDANFVAQVAYLKTNATSDVTALYTKIVGAYSGVFTQAASGLSAYVTSLGLVLTNAQKLTALFDTTQMAKINTLAGNLTTSLTSANITILTTAVPTDLAGLKAYLTDTTKVAVLKAWRAMKAAQ